MGSFSNEGLSLSRKVRVQDSPIHGKGVFAARALKKGERVIEYRGDVIAQDKADELYADDGESGHTFLFTVNSDYLIDGNVRGNAAKWINHGCEPNCEAVLLEAEGDDRAADRVVIEALRDIGKDEELTYDYGIVLEVAHTKRLKSIWVCRCGAATCTGTLLKPKSRKKAA